MGLLQAPTEVTVDQLKRELEMMFSLKQNLALVRL